MDTKIIRNGTLIDGTGRNPVNNAVVVIQGSKIVNIGRNGELKIPKGEKVEIIEADGKTVIPGLIDSHLHMNVLGQSTDFYSLPIYNNSLDILTRAIPALKRTLEMGITTIRDGGSGWDWMEVALKNAINRGDIIGPRYLTTGYHLTVTGGHGYFLPPWLGKLTVKEQSGMCCDGPEEWRRVARLNLANGTDNVKLVASRGFLSAGLRGDALPTAAQATLEEMKAAVDEAHKMGKKAFAHANGPEAIKKAVKAGVDSIVHGFYINEECAELMVEKNVILEPTTLVIKQIVDHGKGEMLDSMVTKANAYWEIKKKEFKMILQKGVAISFSSDTGCPYMYHGENAKELAMCVELGMSPMEAIVSATKTASYAIGMEDEIGTIEKGKLADIIIVNGDPLQNISILCEENKIEVVMKDGKIVKTR
jgi:imidazolonepropionase-like amidohydrolase